MRALYRCVYLVCICYFIFKLMAFLKEVQYSVCTIGTMLLHFLPKLTVEVLYNLSDLKIHNFC
jgi:hypothetical protein